MSGPARLNALLASARPQVVGALARRFRDIDRAEEGYQTACLRALAKWPEQGPPRDPVAWLILVGRNAVIDELRRQSRNAPLDEEVPSEPSGDPEEDTIARMETQDYRDDILRLLFICCRPELSITDQLALALKVVTGLSVQEIARAFLVKPKAMEQRLTLAKRRVAAAGVSFETPSIAERGQRLAAVSILLYLMFNEGYSSAGSGAHLRIALCEDAIRLQRLLLRLFPGQSEVMGLLALCLFQHARAKARLDAEGRILLLEQQDRNLWDPALIAEGRVLLEKALLKGRPGPYQIQAAIAGMHCAAATPEATDWSEIERLYRALERAQPSPVVTLNRAVALAKLEGPAAALALTAALAESLDGYLYFHGARGAWLEELGRDSEAVTAYRRALALCTTPAETEHLRARLAALDKGSTTLSD